jgi:hypothetical protein
LTVNVLLIQVRENLRRPAEAVFCGRIILFGSRVSPTGEFPQRVVSGQQRQGRLLEVVRACRSARGFAGGLNSGQKQGYQHPNNGNHHE